MYKLLDLWEKMPYWDDIEPEFVPLLESYRNTRFYMEKIIQANLAEASADEIEQALRHIDRQQRSQDGGTG
jgi:hypothetical protein